MLFGRLIDSLLTFAHIKQLKNKTIDWWINLNDYKYSEVISIGTNRVDEIFEKIYGKKHLSVRCIIASCISSFIAVSFWFLCFFPLAKNPLNYNLNAEFIFFGTIINFVPDYFSLIETRIILKLCKKIKYRWYLPLFISDLVLSAGIFIFFILLVNFFTINVWGLDAILPSEKMSISNEGEFLGLILLILVFSMSILFLFCLFLSTFFTSFIFYGFLISALAFRAFEFVKKPIIPILEKIGESDKPATILASAISLLLIFLYTSANMMYWGFKLIFK